MYGILRSIDCCSFNNFTVSDEWGNFNSPGSSGSSGKGDSGHANGFFREASFYEKLDKAERAHDRYGMGSGLGASDSYDSLADGMEYKLKKAAAYFEFDPLEVTREDYSFRPDVNFQSSMSYDPKV